MTIPLTEQQQQALDTKNGDLPKLIDPRTNSVYVLVQESEFESVRAILEDERQQRAIRAIALRNAAGRMDEIP